MKIRSNIQIRKAYDDYFRPTNGFPSGEAISRSIVLLERAGFMVDVESLNRKCDKAREDEKSELEALRKDYRNIRKDGKSDEDVDAIWSSSTQLVELIHDYLKLPASPICKKGQVRTWGEDPEIKLDGVALDYLGNEHIEYREFLHRIKNLRAIRGGIKYLSKLPKFVGHDGFIHPTYGAMGDNDDRSGTATGRLGMKNPEGHQIPAEAEKDIYGIRECFIAPPGQVLVVRDYQAMEVVILAFLCDVLFNDQSLYTAVEMGSAFHSKNALNVFGKRLGWVHPISGRGIHTYSLDDFKSDVYCSKLRKDAKTVWYGAQYRKTGRGFGFTLLDANGKPIGIDAGEEVLQAFLEEAPALQRWYDFTDWWLKKHPYMPSPGGRLRYFIDLLETHRWSGKIDWKFRKAARQAGNHPIQAMGAEIMFAGLIACQESAKLQQMGVVMEKTIHDELHARCSPDVADEANELIGEYMNNALPIKGLTTDGGVGSNWRDAK